MAPIRLAMIAAMAAGLAGAGPAPRYAEGQVWAYHTRAGDAGSLLRIQKIEQTEVAAMPETVYHISVVRVHFAGLRQVSEVQHIPVTQAALDASVTHLSSARVRFPDPAEGIAEWRAAHGGVFTIPVDRIVGSMERALHSQQHPPPLPPQDGDSEYQSSIT